MSPYKLVIHALKFGNAVAKIQRALTVSFGVPVTSVHQGVQEFVAGLRREHQNHTQNYQV
jgi:hypothetical protein